MQVLLALLALAVPVAGLAACGEDDATSPSDTATTSKIGGTAVCDRDAIAKAVAATGEADGTTAKLSTDGFTCEAGWAVALADVGPPGKEVTETLVYRAEGQFWIDQDRGKVCPKPSEIPAAIYAKACGSD